MLEKWDQSRLVERDGIFQNLSLETKLKLLSYIAAKKFEKEQYVFFEQKELETYIEEFLGIQRSDSQGILRVIESHHGLLIQRSIVTILRKT